METFRSQLENNILRAIRQAKKDGTVSMSLGNLVQITESPSAFLEGAPKGTNAQYFYREMFEEVVKANQIIRRFTRMAA